MACKLLRLDYNTRFATFSIDKESDVDMLPKMNSPGKGDLSPIGFISPGSKAIGTNGVNYILNGDQDMWVKYNPSSGGNGLDYKIATDDDINSLFE